MAHGSGPAQSECSESVGAFQVQKQPSSFSGSGALSTGLIQTNRKEACRFPMCLLEVCIYTH